MTCSHIFRCILLCGLGLLLCNQSHAARPDVAAVQKKAKVHGYTFEVGENPATQYSLERLCGTKMPAVRQTRMKTAATTDQQLQAAAALPASFDWRKLDGCTPVKNQGGCGACWAFATMGAVESIYLIRSGQTLDFSEQWLISCTESGDCDGGWYETALGYLLDIPDVLNTIGTPLEEIYPYVAEKTDCTCPESDRYTITNWAAVTEDIDAIKEAIYTYGPIIVGVHTDDLFQCYISGIFNASTNGELNHAVVLVGWDDTQGTEGIWILRNSWGSGWGENGYMRIEYGSNNVGAAPCYAECEPDTEPNNYDVPGSYPTIKAAIAAANDGDIITLAPGTYTGTDNTDIDFGGKAMTIRSSSPLDTATVAATIIDCQGNSTTSRRAFVFDKGEIETSVVFGLTIRNGYVRDNGGAVYCYYSSPTFKNCVFENNIATGYKKSGGAIALYNSSPVFVNCDIINNSASSYGGGISCRDNSNPTFLNCRILGNLSGDEGGGIYCWVNSKAKIDHSIIADNFANNAGGGIFIYESGDTVDDPNNPTISFCTIAANNTDGLGGGIFGMDSVISMDNSIVWDNTAEATSGPQIALLDDSLFGTMLSVSYCDVAGLDQGHMLETNCVLDWREGNIDADPLFADPTHYDFHLKSASGRWDISTSGWILDDGDNYDDIDDENSPCIDAGNPEIPVGDEMQCNGGRINLGFDGGTDQASRSPAVKCCMQCIEGDLNCDCRINLEDFMVIAEHWLQCNLLPRYHCIE